MHYTYQHQTYYTIFKDKYEKKYKKIFKAYFSNYTSVDISCSSCAAQRSENIIIIFTDIYYIKLYFSIGSNLILFFEFIQLRLLQLFATKNLKISPLLPSPIINRLKGIEIFSKEEKLKISFKKISYVQISIYSINLILISIIL